MDTSTRAFCAAAWYANDTLDKGSVVIGTGGFKDRPGLIRYLQSQVNRLLNHLSQGYCDLTFICCLVLLTYSFFRLGIWGGQRWH